MQRSSYSADEPPRFVPYDGHVHGVVYRVTKEDFAKLAKREGGYVVEEIEVSCLGLCIVVRGLCCVLATPAVQRRTVVRRFMGVTCYRAYAMWSAAVRSSSAGAKLCCVTARHARQLFRFYIRPCPPRSV